MGWTTPKTWATNEVVTAALLNEQLRDNFNYLMNPSNFLVHEPSSAYTTTSTSWVAVGANYTKTITLYGGPLLVGGKGHASNTTGNTLIGIDIDGATWMSNQVLNTSTTDPRGCFLIHFFIGLGPGNHTVTLKWAATTGTSSLNKATLPLDFWAIEL